MLPKNITKKSKNYTKIPNLLDLSYVEIAQLMEINHNLTI